MAETITLDPAAVATNRTEVDITPFIAQEGPNWGSAEIAAYMADLSLGSNVVDYRTPTRTITIPLNLRTVGAVTFNTIRAQLHAKVGLFQREGGWMKRVLSGGVTVYADVVNASLTLGDQWMATHRDAEVGATLTLEVIPDFYGAEDTLALSTIINAGGKYRGTITGHDGDGPGRLRIVVTDTEGASYLGMVGCIRQRHYSSAATAAPSYEAEALTPLDTAAIATRTGAMGGGSNNVIRHSNLSTGWTPVLNTNLLAGTYLTHTGTYAVYARVYSPDVSETVSVKVRFVWDVGDLVNPEENAEWTLPTASNFYLAPLGIVRLEQGPAGTHRWQGQVQAKGSAGGKDIDIDELLFVNLDEAEWRLQTPLSLTEGLAAYSARSEFTTEAGAITGDSLAVGGTWVGAGDADDFSVSAGVATRTAVSDAGSGTEIHNGRLITASTPTLSNVAARVRFSSTQFYSPIQERALGLVLRYVDISNFLAVVVSPTTGFGGTMSLYVWKREGGGTPSQLASAVLPTLLDGTYYSLKALATATGQVKVWFEDELRVSLENTSLATGGALDDGKVGIVDWKPGVGAVTRTYDDFAAWVPSLDAVLHASQSLEIASDGVFREDSTGSAYGPVVSLGDDPRLSPEGLESRTAELFVRLSRGDLDQLPDSSATDDAFGVVAYHRPSWLFGLES